MSTYSYQIHVAPGVIGHAMITLTGPNGSITVGFYPESDPILITDNAYTFGRLDDDTLRSQQPEIWHSPETTITEAQFTAMSDFVSSHQINAGWYSVADVGGLNCATFVEATLNAGGITGHDVVVHPLELIDWSPTFAEIESQITSGLVDLSQSMASIGDLFDSLNNPFSGFSAGNFFGPFWSPFQNTPGGGLWPFGPGMWLPPLAPISAAFGAAQQMASPIILDLDGNGVQTTGVTAGSYFDHDANGFIEPTGWVGQGDGLLVWDRNGNGQIDDGTELFGSQTLLADGTKAANGFAALAELDDNHDGKIDVADAVYTGLKVWRDVDGNGYTSSGELMSLTDADIASIATGYTTSSAIDANGNEHREIGSFTRTDGTAGAAEDVWFRTDKTYTVATEWLTVPADIAALPDLRGYGNVYSLHQAMVRDTSGGLKGLVESFAAANDVVTRESIFRNILYRWTGNDSLAPSCRGSYMTDGRELYVLEDLLGETFIQSSGENAGTPNPGSDAAHQLERTFDLLFEKFYAAMMAQTHLKGLYDLVTYSWDDASQSLKGSLDGIATLLLSEIGLDPVAGKARLSEFARSAVALDADVWANFSGFRSQFSALGNDWVWVIDSVAKTPVAGTEANDVLSGNYANDALRGYGGNDTLNGYDGDDALYGGGGMDTLYGGKGNDTYVFGVGDGQDTISENDTTPGNRDAIRILGVAAAEVSLLRTHYSNGNVTSDLLLQINGTSDTLTIKNYFAAGTPDQYKVEQVQFDDGTTWTTTELDKPLIVPTTQSPLYGSNLSDTFDLRSTANNWVSGGGSSGYGYGNDTYLFGVGSGQDTILDSDPTAGNTDTIRLLGFSPADVTRLRTIYANGNLTSDLLLKFDGATDTLLIQNYFVAANQCKIERVEFDDGTVWTTADLEQTVIAPTTQSTVYGSSLAETFDLRNAANTWVSGGAYGSSGYGNDTYLFSVGSGQDTIRDNDPTAGNTDTIRLMGTSPVDVSRLRTINSYGYATNDLMLKFGSDSLTVESYFSSGGTQYKIERVEFDDGTIWTPADLDQALIVPTTQSSVYGSALADTFDLRNAANTWVSGGAYGSSAYGNDTYLFGVGSGQDTVRDNDSTAGNVDAAEFAGVLADQLWLRHVGSNLEVSIIGTTDKMTIQNWYSGAAYHIEQFQAGGMTLLDSDVENLVQAMAAFDPPAAGQTTLPQNYQDALTPVIAANWH